MRYFSQTHRGWRRTEGGYGLWTKGDSPVSAFETFDTKQKSKFPSPECPGGHGGGLSVGGSSLARTVHCSSDAGQVSPCEPYGVDECPPPFFFKL